MYKVLIVDDEILARVGMKSILPWEKHGYEIIGEAENGHKAYEMIKTEQPDIVISDIKMPIVDGIQLITRVREEGYNTRFIVLSTYNSFEYVKEALKAGADDYLLKLEMEPDKLLEVLDNVKKKITQVKKSQNLYDDQVKLIAENISVLKEKFIKELMFGKMHSEENIIHQLEHLHINLKGEKKLCLAIRIDNMDFFDCYNDEEMYRLQSTFNSVVENVIGAQCYGISSHVKGRVFATVVSYADSWSKEEAKEKIAYICKNITEVLKNTLNMDVTICISSIYSHYTDIYKAYREAMDALEQASQHMLKGIFTYDAIKNQEVNKARVNIDHDIKKIKEAFEDFDGDKVGEALVHIVTKFVDSKNTPKEYLKGTCYNLIYLYNNFVKNNEMLNRFSIEEDSRLYSAVDKIIIMEDYVNWMHTLEKMMKDVIHEMTETSMIIVRSKQYIKSHFTERISLEAISEYIGFSPNYFSRIFREEVGVNYVDYVTSLRIDYAKELLRSCKYKIYEVSDMVGYENPHYFSRIFKKVTNMSPIEYKNIASVPKKQS